MNIAIFSDSHDAYANFDKAISICNERGIQNALHCGDICAPFMISRMVDSGLNWWSVFGNVDGEKVAALRMADQTKVTLSNSDFLEFEIAGRLVFITHFPEIAQLAAASNKYSAVFFGHTHEKSVQVFDNGTILANPGEVCGVRFGHATFAIWDIEKKSVDFIEI